jgi:large subunit ribosomal protein L15
MVEKKKTPKTKKPGASGAAPKKAKSAKPAASKAAARSKAAAAKPATPPAPKAARPPRPQRKAAEAPSRPPATGVHDLAPAPGATHYRKRVGRGPGSGHGKTAGRGYKGQRSRTGYRHQRGFEGGQMPLHRRLPKRGFTNIFRVEYDIVNISDLDRFEAGAAVTPEALSDLRLTRKNRPVKILGDGKIQKALTVSAHKFSASAKAGIEAAGGRCEVLSR